MFILRIVLTAAGAFLIPFVLLFGFATVALVAASVGFVANAIASAFAVVTAVADIGTDVILVGVSRRVLMIAGKTGSGVVIDMGFRIYERFDGSGVFKRVAINVEFTVHGVGTGVIGSAAVVLRRIENVV